MKDLSGAIENGVDDHYLLEYLQKGMFSDSYLSLKNLLNDVKKRYFGVEIRDLFFEKWNELLKKNIPRGSYKKERLERREKEMSFINKEREKIEDAFYNLIRGYEDDFEKYKNYRIIMFMGIPGKYFNSSPLFVIVPIKHDWNKCWRSVRRYVFEVIKDTEDPKDVKYLKDYLFENFAVFQGIDLNINDIKYISEVGDQRFFINFLKGVSNFKWVIYDNSNGEVREL